MKVEQVPSTRTKYQVLVPSTKYLCLVLMIGCNTVDDDDNDELSSSNTAATRSSTRKQQQQQQQQQGEQKQKQQQQQQQRLLMVLLFLMTRIDKPNYKKIKLKIKLHVLNNYLYQLSDFVYQCCIILIFMFCIEDEVNAAKEVLQLLVATTPFVTHDVK